MPRDPLTRFKQALGGLQKLKRGRLPAQQQQNPVPKKLPGAQHATSIVQSSPTPSVPDNKWKRKKRMVETMSLDWEPF